ncbi:MAG TPA: hypothetical protein VFI72_18425 [Candidatus Angelobacter sp.]|nr:hypothetical protein [Candidatus Angelobacter sp.]
MTAHFRFDFTFPRNYEVKVMTGPPPVHPLEKLYHYPLELEEGDRAGVYLRVVPEKAPVWRGFFALGFESPQVINAVCSCPNPTTLCVIAGGYAYIVNTENPSEWVRLEQRPVVDFRALPEHHLLLFAGFTTITAVGPTGIAWTTERLSWEGVRITELKEGKLHGFGWDAISDKELPFEVDLATGAHSGGAKP